MKPDEPDEQSLTMEELSKLKKTDPERFARLMAARRARIDRERAEETGLDIAALRHIAEEELSSSRRPPR